MSDIDEKIIEKDEKKNKTDTPAAKNPPVFSLERLAKDCYTLFKVSSSTFAGATCHPKKDKEHTVEEMKAIIEKWLKTPIKRKKKEAK